MKLIIEDDEGRKTVVPLVRDEISVGRLEGNTIRLTERNVSRRHARLVRQNGSIYVEDLGSYTGVRVNGEKISAKQAVKEGDLIEIGDYDLQIEGAPDKSEGDTNPTVREEAPQPPPSRDRERDRAVPPTVPAAPMPVQRQSAAQAPSTTKKSEATAMIRLSDLAGGGGSADEERDLGGNEQPRLVAITGSLRGKEFPLRRSVVKVGRSADEGNQIVIDHQSISRQHAKFQMEAGQWKLYDNKSANGIRVNGDEYGMSPVKPGDTIELGHVKFRFCAPGEVYSPPREAAATVSAPAASAPAEPVAAKKNNMPMIAGAIGGVVVIGGIIAFVATRGPATPKGPDVGTFCSAAQMAMGNQNWSEAVKQLSIVQSMPGGTCPFPVPDTLATAKRNQDAKQSLEEADQLIADGKARQAIKLLQGIPDGTPYDSERRLKEIDAKKVGVRKLSAEADDNLQKGRLDDAKSAIDAIRDLDPEAGQLPLLEQTLAQKRKASAAPKEPPPPAKKPIEERNKIAEGKLAEANGLIKSGNLQGGIDMLLQVIAEEPSVELQGKAHRNLGVAYARAGNTAKAIEHYKLYIKLVPDAPERAKIEQLIKQSGG